MNNTNATIQKGDLVFIYLDSRRQFVVQVAPGMQLQSDFGNIHHNDIIGQPHV
jgi:tRNA A58 N-methylase Trm61